MLREIFIKDWGWKSFSILLAATIWLTVHKIIEEPKVSSVASGSPLTISTPVLIVASAADVHLYRVMPNTVSVVVSGAPDDIAELRANQIRATVDLTGIDAGRKLQRHVDVSVPSGITLISVDPPRVDVLIPSPPTNTP